MKRLAIYCAYLILGAIGASVIKSILGVEVTAPSDVAILVMRMVWFMFGAGLAWPQWFFFLKGSGDKDD